MQGTTFFGLRRVKWDNFLLPWRKKWYSYLGKQPEKTSKRKCSLQITEGSKKTLSQKMPLHGQWATDRQKLQKFPDPSAASENVSRWSHGLQLVLGFCSRPYLKNTVLTEVTALSPPVWQTPLLSPQAVFWSNTLIKTRSQIFLLFPCKSIQEWSCTKAVRQMTASKKNQT